MRQFWPILALVLVAAAPTADETRQYRVAQAAFDDKLYEVAERQFGEFLQKFPQSERADTAQFQLGQAQLNLGQWEEAVRTFQEAKARWPDKRPDGIRFWLGEAYSRGGKFAEAAVQYGELAEKFPHSPNVARALYGLAFAQLKQKQFAAAGEALDKLAKATPKEDLAFEADLLRGQLYLAKQDFEKAEAVLTALAQRAGSSRVFYRAQVWLGESLTRRQQYPDALSRYAAVTDAYKTKPNRPVDAQLAAEAWYGSGWTRWQMNDFAGAAESFNAALTNAVTAQLKRDALLKLAEASVRNGKIADGVARLKEFLQTRPADPLADEVQLAIGDLLYGSGQPAAALPEYGQLISAYTNSVMRGRAYEQAGWCAWQLKKLPEALGFFQQALPLAKTGGVQLKIADCQFALGQFKEAVASYTKFEKNFPTDPARDHACFQVGEAERRLEDYDGAIASFERLVKQFPESALAPQAQYNLGNLLATQGQEAAARTAYAVVVRNFPTSVWASNAALAVGESFNREGKYDQAVAEFDRLAVNGLDTELAQQAFYSRGCAQALAGKREKTLGEFREFLKAHPQATLAPEIQYWVGHDYLRARNYTSAQEQFQSLAETHPTSKLADEALYFAGRAAYARQDYKAAIELYEALVKKFPQSNRRCEARFGQGDALSELGQFDDALLVFESLIKDFPDCSVVCEATGRKGDCQYTLGRYEDALASYRKALDCGRDAGLRNQTLFKLGQTYEAQKKFDEAFQVYTKAILEATVVPDPNEPPERFWSCKAARSAANLKEQQDQWREAITLYEKVAANCPDLKALAEDRIRKLRVQHPETFFQR